MSILTPKKVKLSCPESSTGHVWVLHVENRDTYWVHKPRLTLFRKRVVFEDHHYMFPVLFEIRRTWYCSLCQRFEHDIEEVESFDTYLKAGYAVYNWRERQMLYPDPADSRRLAEQLERQ